jgi:hypothetical protein
MHRLTYRIVKYYTILGFKYLDKGGKNINYSFTQEKSIGPENFNKKDMINSCKLTYITSLKFIHTTIS